MPTAEEFIRKYIRDIGGRDYSHEIIDVEDAIEALIEFAKEAIKADRIELAKFVNKRLENESQIKAFIIDGTSIINAPNIELL